MPTLERNKYVVPLVTLVVLCVAALLYWPGLNGAFMLDDQQNIVAIQKDLSPSAVAYNIMHNDSGLLGRSVSVLSFYLSQWEFGPAAWGYKFHNLVLHLINGLLLARLLYVIVTLFDRKVDRRRALLVAGITATLWLVHPLLVSTVLYAVQRMAELSALFTMLSLLTYLKVRTFDSFSGAYFWRAWILLPLFILLALLSKESGALIPVYMLMFEVLGFRSGRDTLRKARHHAAFLAVFVGVPLLAGTAILILKFGSLTEYSTRNFTLGERLLTQVHALAFYLRMLLLPRLHSMSLFHDDYPVTHGFDAVTLGLMACYVLMLAVAWRLRASKPVVSIGLAWFFVSHLLESTIFPLELVFEHRNYLAAAGILLIPVYLVFTEPVLKAGRYVCGLYLLMFAFMTHSRVMEWSREAVTLQIAVTEHPGSPRAHNAMANFLMEHNNLDGAIQQLETAARLDPRNPGANLQLLGAKCSNGISYGDEMEQAKQQLARYPLTVYALNSLDSLISSIANGKCKNVSLDDFGQLVDAAMAQEKNHENLEYYAYLLRFSGIHALMTKKYAEGYADFRYANEYTGRVSYLGELARYQIDFGELDDARDTLDVMKRQSEAKFGLEAHQVEMVERYLQAAREKEQAASQTAGKALDADKAPREATDGVAAGTVPATTAP